MKAKIKKVLKANEYDFPIGDKYGDLQEICTMWDLIDCDLDIGFTVNIAGGDEQYLEAVYWCEKIKASIVLDSGVVEEYEDLESVVREAERLQKRIAEIDKLIK